MSRTDRPTDRPTVPTRAASPPAAPLTLTQIRRVVERATLAPSLHNAQPWRFTAHRSAGVTTIDVRVDRDRALTSIDPAGRQLLVSVGAAIEFARLAVRAEGRACDVTLTPDPADPDLAARLHVGSPSEPTAEERALVRAMPRRATDRLPYDGRPVPEGVVERLRQGVEVYGAWLRPLRDRTEIVTTATLVSEAEGRETADPSYAAELAHWVRPDDDASDGIPRSALEDVHARSRATDVPIRDFLGAAPSGPDDTAAPPPLERALVLALGTGSDLPTDVLAAGRALGWILLRLTVDGLAASPVAQALDAEPTRSRLTRALGVVGHAHMLLRVGYGRGRPVTHRRPVDDVLTVVTAIP